ncbi:MAG: hypothetical protein BWZ10_02744 [candidate division BRC1 bacterium ADurb.BinA364]|nr:MAG: hypothetical protein BWZ10_02744 [candidate division BRC1 bacterium ADurb.BinA364]
MADRPAASKLAPKTATAQGDAAASGPPASAMAPSASAGHFAAWRRAPNPPARQGSPMRRANASGVSATSGQRRSSAPPGAQRRNRAAYTSPRRASSIGAASRPGSAKRQARASRVETAAIGLPHAIARALASAMPMRRPVNEPGPAETAMPSKSLSRSAARRSMASMAGIRRTLWVAEPSFSSTASARPSRQSAAPPSGVEVSIARSSMKQPAMSDGKLEATNGERRERFSTPPLAFRFLPFPLSVFHYPYNFFPLRGADAQALNLDFAIRCA